MAASFRQKSYSEVDMDALIFIEPFTRHFCGKALGRKRIRPFAALLRSQRTGSICAAR
jgi:hypothetical protein